MGNHEFVRHYNNKFQRLHVIQAMQALYVSNATCYYVITPDMDVLMRNVEIYEQYENGTGTNELAELFGLSRGYVQEIIKYMKEKFQEQSQTAAKVA